MTTTIKSLMKMSNAYWETCTLQAALQLDLFTLLGHRSLTAEEIRTAISGSERGVASLLNAITAMGLLARQGNTYVNTDEGYRLLSRESPDFVGYIILHHHDLMAAWEHLSDAVRTGKPQRTRASWDDESQRENFLMGMYTLAMQLGSRIAETVDFSGRRSLLDLGGGPGTYAVHFCLKNPSLQAVIFDLPTSRPFAEQVVARHGLEGRIRFLGGNYVQDELTGRYDVIWLSQILHGEGPETCEAIIRKAASVLEPGGMILIHEFLLNDTLDSPLFPALFSLNMLIGTPSGQSYSEGQVRAMMVGAGIENIRRLPFQGPNDSGIIMGTAPTAG